MTTKGLEADLAQLMALEDSAADGDQLGLELFDDFASPVELLRESRKVDARRGPGRPKGSKSRATVDLVRLIKATKRPTLLAIKEMADLGVHELAAMLGCTLTEAWDRWYKVAELSAAYEEGRPTQRVELDVDGPVMPVLMLGAMPVRPDLVHGNPPGESDLLNVTEFGKVEEDQSLSDYDPVEVSRT